MRGFSNCCEHRKKNMVGFTTLANTTTRKCIMKVACFGAMSAATLSSSWFQGIH